MKKALIGNGGHAREVICQFGEELVRFVDDEFLVEGDDKILPLSKFSPDEFEILVAIGDSEIRKDLVNRLPKNTKYFSFIHPTAQIMSSDVRIGEGSFIGANSIITCNVKLGKHILLNRGNQIGHDSVIGDFFSAMPGAIVSGNVKIGDVVYLGTNCSIKENINISNNIKVGMNSAVVKNLTTKGIYVGCPAKILNNEI